MIDHQEQEIKFCDGLGTPRTEAASVCRLWCRADYKNGFEYATSRTLTKIARVRDFDSTLTPDPRRDGCLRGEPLCTVFMPASPRCCPALSWGRVGGARSVSGVQLPAMRGCRAGLSCVRPGPGFLPGRVRTDQPAPVLARGACVLPKKPPRRAVTRGATTALPHAPD